MRQIRWYLIFVLMGASTLAAQELATVTGTIRLVDNQKQRPHKDSSQVAVWLEPMEREQAVPVGVSETTPRLQILQQGKHFTPHLLAVPLGSKVRFPNRDPWFHNVFSLYQGKRFDLGLYEAGSEKAVRFDRPGPSFIFCNIHPEMSAVVLVVNSHWIGVSSRKGRVSIGNVPPGRYRLRLWYEFAASEAPVEGGEVTVGSRGLNFGTITVQAVPPAQQQHTNKYGQEYDPQSLTPEY
jgi:plastocyanin